MERRFEKSEKEEELMMRKILDGTKETLSHWTYNENEKPVLLVDFDHTITRKCLACDDGLKGDGLQEGVRDALQALKTDFKIWIFTGNPLLVTESAGLVEGEKYGRTIQEIEDFLKKNDIPYDKIFQTKPPACFIIDDRAIHHCSWAQTMKEIEKRRRQ